MNELLLLRLLLPSDINTRLRCLNVFSQPREATIDPEPGVLAISRRFFHKIFMNRMDTTLKIPIGESLMKTESFGLTVQDAKKLLRAAHIEVVKTKLMETGKSGIPYSDFVRLDSGNVIVLEDSVCLRPDQVTKSIEGLLPLPQIRNPNDPKRKELKELETIKTIIVEKAHSLVRRELWAGMGYLIIHISGFRLSI